MRWCHFQEADGGKAVAAIIRVCHLESQALCVAGADSSTHFAINVQADYCLSDCVVVLHVGRGVENGMVQGRGGRRRQSHCRSHTLQHHHQYSGS